MALWGGGGRGKLLGLTLHYGALARDCSPLDPPDRWSFRPGTVIAPARAATAWVGRRRGLRSRGWELHLLDACQDLAAPSRRAREAALRAVAGTAPCAEATEPELLAVALQTARHDAGERVFANSLRLGRGYAQRCETPLEELPHTLSQLGAPCLNGAWRACSSEDALVLERPPCDAATGGPAVCDWWREAIEGLVLGMTHGALYTRHESGGHGCARCIDVVYTRPESALRFGPIPTELQPTLATASRRAKLLDSSVELRFLGVSEQTLYYEIKRKGCGGDISVTGLVERLVARSFPALRLAEISPRPVLGETNASRSIGLE